MQALVELTRLKWLTISGNVRGSLCMLAAALCASSMVALIKHVGQNYPVVEILFIRQVFVCLIISPVIARNIGTVFQTEHRRIYFLRVVISTVAMLTGFTAVVHLPLAEVTAISFCRTLFVTLLAIVILKETVGIRRWTSTLVGFLGVLIVIRPDTENINFYAISALISALFLAANAVILRKVSQVDPPSTIMTYQTLLVTIILTGPAYYFWVTPTLSDVLLILGAATLVSLIQYFMIQAYRHGEASAIAPVEYVRLIFATLLGMLIFGETPTIWTIIGATVIIASTVYTVHRNAVTKTNPTKSGT